MSALRLKLVMEGCGLSVKALAASVDVDRPRLSELINHGHWPRGKDRARLKQLITKAVARAGGATSRLFQEAATAARKKAPPRANAARPTSPPPSQPQDDDEVLMLLRKQMLLPDTRRHFQLARDPFEEVASQEDVYLNADLRYVRESMYQVARHGGFLAVIGESGAGKSTLRLDLIERVRRDEESILVIEPYVVAMEQQDKIGKTLRPLHIAEAVMAAIDPLAKTMSSPEARFAQLHRSLRNSARAGHSHVLIIEEAHGMPLATLKQLKRFRELRDGMRPLLSIILLGHPELALMLSERNPEVREVVQRIEVVTLPPLGTDVEAYLKHRFSRIGMPLEKVFGPGAVGALREKLTPTRAASLLYPLAIANATTAALNRAAEMKYPLLTPDVVKGA